MREILEYVKEVLAYLSPFLLVAAGVLAWLYQHERERRAEIEKQLSDKKYTTYIKLLNIFFGQMKAAMMGATSNAPPAPELVEQMFDASKNLMIYGSDEVLISYENWMTKMRGAQGADTTGVLRGLAQIVIAIRKDMGHPDTTVTSDHVLRLLLKDFDEAKARGLV